MGRTRGHEGRTRVMSIRLYHFVVVLRLGQAPHTNMQAHMDETVTPPSHSTPEAAPQRQGLEPIHLVPFCTHCQPFEFRTALPLRGWAP